METRDIMQFRDLIRAERTTHEHDFNSEAASMAQYVSDSSFDIERGAILDYRAGVCVAFGNDGFAGDQRSKDEVHRVSDALNRLGIKILGFGTDPRDGYSWAMLIETSDIEMLRTLVRTSWHFYRPRHPRTPPLDED